MVVGVSAIVTQKSHRVILGDMLRMSLHELLGAVPEGRDSLHVFVQTQNETVLLLVGLHEFENIVIDVAVELNAWLNSPVVLVVEHQRLAEEEPRFESAHMAITDGISVNDLLRGHVLPNLSSFILIDVFWKRPVLLRNLSVMGFA